MLNPVKLNRAERKVLEEDLRKLLGGLDIEHGAYDPGSRGFQSAALIAQILSMCDDAYEESYAENFPEKKEGAAPAAVFTCDCGGEAEGLTEEHRDRILDEVADSSYYLEQFSKTHDARYLVLAKDELRHGQTLSMIYGVPMPKELNSQRIKIDSEVMKAKQHN